MGFNSGFKGLNTEELMCLTKLDQGARQCHAIGTT